MRDGLRTDYGRTEGRGTTDRLSHGGVYICCISVLLNIYKDMRDNKISFYG